MACVLVAADGGRTMVKRVGAEPEDVPWAPGARAASIPGGARIESCDSGSVELAFGRAAVIGDVTTSCHEVAAHVRGTNAVSLAGRLEAASEAMIGVFHLISIYAPVHEPVLLLGESGTGKELAARTVHDLGPAPDDPFVALNMAAIPSDLAEAELFGWVRGAFTGAADARPGAFEAAGRGTIFLDEIGEAAPEIQAKVLRAVETGAVHRLGSHKPVQVRARVIAATNVDVLAATSDGRFRLDLLQRLSCLVVRIPPLRERKEDVAVIAESLCRGLPGRPSITPGGRRLLAKHDWPGNARELRNVVVRASLCSAGGVLDAGVLRDSIDSSPLDAATGPPGKGYVPVLPTRVTRSHQIALSGLPRSTFYYRLKRGRIATV